MSRTINKAIIHHSVSSRDQTLAKSIKSFNANHKKRLHPNKNSLGLHISYHYVIAWDGSYQQTRWINEVGYHASNLKINKESIGICFTGNFDNEKPTEAQYKSAIKILSKYPKVSIHWHNEYATKSCPWRNLDLNRLKEMLFYESMRRKVHWKTPIDNRIFKDPEAFLERIKDLSIEDKLSEMTFLIAILSEKASKKD